MIEVDFRAGDAHHYYHIKARDAAQLERIKAYIRSRVAARDADLTGAPPIDGARISTQRGVRRVPNNRSPRPSPRSAPRPSPPQSAFEHYGSLGWEGVKRGLVGTVALAADAANVMSPQYLSNKMMAAAHPKEYAALREAYPVYDGDYIRRLSERWGVTHPNVEAHGFWDHLALDGAEFVGGSFVPGAGWVGAARNLVRGGKLLARATNPLERLVIGTARHPWRAATTVAAGAVGSVTGGEIAERLGLPRWMGELPGSLLGGGVEQAAAKTARAAREAAHTRRAMASISPEEANRAIREAQFRQDKINRLDMGNVMTMGQKLRGQRKVDLDGFLMADAVPILLKRKQSGEDMLAMHQWSLDDLQAPRARSNGGGTWSLPQLASSALNDWRYRTAVKHYRGSWQDWFLRQHPELADHLRVAQRAPVPTRLSRNTYLPKSKAQLEYEKTGELPANAIEADLATYPVDVLALPSRVLDPVKGDSYKRATAAAKSYLRRVSLRLGLKGKGIDLHHNDPVSLGGAPADSANLIPLSKKNHENIVTPWWDPLIRSR